MKLRFSDMKPLWTLLIAAVWIFSGQSWAAYRVYQLKIRSFDERNRPQKSTLVLSSLDPQQYENYHSGYGRMLVSLVDTWYCPGDTSGKAYCQKPKNKKLQRGPAGIFAPKRELDFNRQPIIP